MVVLLAEVATRSATMDNHYKWNTLLWSEVGRFSNLQELVFRGNRLARADM